MVASGLEGPRGMTFGPTGCFISPKPGWAAHKRCPRAVRACLRQLARIMAGRRHGSRELSQTVNAPQWSAAFLPGSASYPRETQAALPTWLSLTASYMP